MKDAKITAEEATNVAGVGMFQVKLVILSGIVWMARGFEMIVSQSVTPLLACTWDLKQWHGSLLNTITFISNVVGCCVCGIWSDTYGRRTALSSTLTLLFVFGAVSAGLPNFTWFAIFRAVAAFSVGGFPQTLVLCCEFFPSSNRGRAVFVLSCFWALSVVTMLWVLFMTVENKDGWKLFVAIGTLPAFVAMCLMRFFPESFRYLMVIEKYFAANDIMSEMIEANGKKVDAQLKPLPPDKPRSHVLDFFRAPFVRASALFCLMGFVTSISFLGLEAVTPYLVQERVNIEAKVTNISSMDFMGDQYQPIECVRSIPREDFIFITWSTALDFPSFVIYMILVDVIDRKILLCASYALSSLFIFLLFIPTSIHILYIVFIYCARTLLHGQFDLILLMVAETFPTTHRGAAVGFEVATFHFGQYLGSYINKGLLSLKIMYHLIFYGSVTILCSVACWGLEHETRERELQDVIQKDTSDENSEMPTRSDNMELDRADGSRTTVLLSP